MYGVVVRVNCRTRRKMTEESSTAEHLSVATVTTDATEITGGNGFTSSSSGGLRFYFRCAVVAIGVVGTITNGLILYALFASKQHKKHALIVNQNLFDLFSCLFLVVSYSVKLCNVRLVGSACASCAVSTQTERTESTD